MKRKMILCLVIAFSGLLVSAANASLLPTGFVGNVKTNATGEPSYWIQVISGNVGVYEVLLGTSRVKSNIQGFQKNNW